VKADAESDSPPCPSPKLPLVAATLPLLLRRHSLSPMLSLLTVPLGLPFIGGRLNHIGGLAGGTSVAAVTSSPPPKQGGGTSGGHSLGCGNFCGQGWCNGGHHSEWDADGNHCGPHYGPPQMTRSGRPSCADSCCRSHDICCAPGGNNPPFSTMLTKSCNREMLNCLSHCVSSDSSCTSTGSFKFGVSVSMVSMAMGMAQDWCCGHPCPTPAELQAASARKHASTAGVAAAPAVAAQQAHAPVVSRRPPPPSPRPPPPARRRPAYGYGRWGTGWGTANTHYTGFGLVAEAAASVPTAGGPGGLTLLLAGLAGFVLAVVVVVKKGLRKAGAGEGSAAAELY